jgi:hypothetical protein
MASDGEAWIFEARNAGQLGVGGCLTTWMYVVFSVIPIMLVLFTIGEFSESPIGLSLFYVASLFPLAALFVLRRLMSRHALRIAVDGTVEAALPFKSIRIAPADLASIRAASVNAAAPGASPIRKAYVYFLSVDGTSQAVVPFSAFTQAQWQDFYRALAAVRPEVTVG